MSTPPKQIISYAQNREDIILHYFFRDVKDGTYVDIGAHHPTEDSVTRFFYERGWRGINVEPNSKMYRLLCRERPEDININAGISDQSGKLELRVYHNSGLSTFSPKMKAGYDKLRDEKVRTYSDVTVPVITLKTLFEKYPQKQIHFMKVDVEGYEYKVLNGNDWSRFRPEMICIESNKAIEDFHETLITNKYKKVWNDGLNDYYLAAESHARTKNFDYTKDMILGDQVLPYHVFNRIHDLQSETERQKVMLELLNIKIDYLEDEKRARDQIIADQKRVRNAFRILLSGIDKAVFANLNRLLAVKTSGDVFVRQIMLPNKTKDPHELIDYLSQSDLEAFYSEKIVKLPKPSLVKRLLYVFLYSLYWAVRKPLVLLAKKLGLKK